MVDDDRPVVRLGRRQLLRAAVVAGAHGFLTACGGRGVGELLVSESRGPAAHDAIRRGAQWLWYQQGSDGRFQSKTYGLLRSGQSLTPFVLRRLLRVPGAIPRDGPERAGDAMIGMLAPSGALGFATSAPDYPCYATGLMASCLGILGGDRAARVGPLVIDWLRSQQLRGAAGWSEHPAQGGWGMGDRLRRQPPDAGHVDLSMTRRVVEGLRSLGVPTDDPALIEARDFVSRCQTADGSFVYSPVELALNKGHRGESGDPRGYGSATCDGVLSLLALGIGDSDPAECALDWLRTNHRVDANPGVVGGPMEPFAEAMRGYYRAGAATCFAEAGGPAGWRAELIATVVAEQLEDGSWLNENPLQKENDPLIATALALTALLEAR